MVSHLLSVLRVDDSEERSSELPERQKASEPDPFPPQREQHISEDGQSVTVRHAEAELTAYELQNVRVVKDESGWWNKLSLAERKAGQNALLTGARKVTGDSDLLVKATRNLTEQLMPLQQKHSFTMTDEVLP